MADESTIIQRASRSTPIIMMLGLGFSAGGITLMRQGQLVLGSGLAVMFGIMGIVAFITLLPGSNALELSPDGFRTKRLFQRGDTIPWKDVAGFEVDDVGKEHRVVFNFADPDRKATDYRGAVRGTAKWAGALPDDYGRGARALADTLNEWRSRAMA